MANGKVSYAIRTYVLGAGETVRIDRHSAFLVCLEASDLFKVAFDDGEENDFEGGITYSPQDGFQSVMLRNDGASANTVKLGFGKGNVTDARLNLPGSITNREEPLSLEASWSKVTYPAGSANKLFNANQAVSFEGVFNEGPGVAWLSEASNAAGVGVPLFPGEKAVQPINSELWVFADGGDITISKWRLG